MIHDMSPATLSFIPVRSFEFNARSDSAAITKRHRDKTANYPDRASSIIQRTDVTRCLWFGKRIFLSELRQTNSKTGGLLTIKVKSKYGFFRTQITMLYHIINTAGSRHIEYYPLSFLILIQAPIPIGITTFLIDTALVLHFHFPIQYWKSSHIGHAR